MSEERQTSYLEERVNTIEKVLIWLAEEQQESSSIIELSIGVEKEGKVIHHCIVIKSAPQKIIKDLLEEFPRMRISVGSGGLIVRNNSTL